MCQTVGTEKKGKQTAGVDGQIALTSSDRIKLYNILKEYNIKHIRPRLAKRAYIPKKNGKRYLNLLHMDSDLNVALKTPLSI